MPGLLSLAIMPTITPKLTRLTEQPETPHRSKVVQGAQALRIHKDRPISEIMTMGMARRIIKPCHEWYKTPPEDTYT